MFLQRTRTAQNALLVEFADTGHIEHSCLKAGVSSQSHRRWMRQYKGYRRRFERARRLSIEKAEAACDRRGIVGFEEPVFFNGKECGTKRRFSDALLMFRLRALAPDKYRDREGGDTNVVIQQSVEAPGAKVVAMMSAINVSGVEAGQVNGAASGKMLNGSSSSSSV